MCQALFVSCVLWHLISLHAYVSVSKWRCMYISVYVHSCVSLYLFLLFDKSRHMKQSNEKVYLHFFLFISITPKWSTSLKKIDPFQVKLYDHLSDTTLFLAIYRIPWLLRRFFSLADTHFLPMDVCTVPANYVYTVVYTFVHCTFLL